MVHFDLSFPHLAQGSSLQSIYGFAGLTPSHAIHAGNSSSAETSSAGDTGHGVTQNLVLNYAGQSSGRISVHLAYNQVSDRDPMFSEGEAKTQFDTDVTLQICPLDRHCSDTLVTLGNSGARLRLGAAPYDVQSPAPSEDSPPVNDPK